MIYGGLHSLFCLFVCLFVSFSHSALATLLYCALNWCLWLVPAALDGPTWARSVRKCVCLCKRIRIHLWCYPPWYMVDCTVLFFCLFVCLSVYLSLLIQHWLLYCIIPCPAYSHFHILAPHRQPLISSQVCFSFCHMQVFWFWHTHLWCSLPLSVGSFVCLSFCLHALIFAYPLC